MNIVRTIKKKHESFVKRLTSNQKKLLYLLEFFIVFNLILTPLYVLGFTDTEVNTLNVATAELSYKVLKGLGVNVSLAQDYVPTLELNEMKIYVSNACSGLIPLFLMLSLIVAVPNLKLKTKLKYILIFLPTVYFVNLVRIVATILLGYKFGVKVFDLFHIFIWKYVLTLIVLILWSAMIVFENVILTYE